MAEEEQGAEEGGEDVWCNAVKGFPDGVLDGVGPWGGGGRALCQGGGDPSSWPVRGPLYRCSFRNNPNPMNSSCVSSGSHARNPMTHTHGHVLTNTSYDLASASHEIT